jgi:flagellar basal body-associated protein FliL
MKTTKINKKKYLEGQKPLRILMETKHLIMAILITVVALFALTALFIWLGSKLEDQFAKQRDKARKLDQPKPDIHEEIQNTLAERQRIIDELNK